ncbi:MAG TPA: glycoside hydrolase family 5 protein [Steroidobacteraceae bacterium]|nr:glycoside hydrolase family 5 protein [Steroidobacteraceae bacterium]
MTPRARMHLPGALLCGLLAVAGSAGTAAAADSPLSAADQVAQMGRGINILGYDPLWEEHGRARFQPRHFQVIHDGGFSTVRIVLIAFRFMNARNELPASWFATLDRLVRQALQQNLTVILDEHDYNDCGADVATCRPKLMAFWTQVAAHYRNAPARVLFEILNEPNESANAAWNDMLSQALGIIRSTNPTRNVIIGPGAWNSVEWLDKLVLPGSDRHIIVTVHYYIPMTFTSQGITWVPEYARLSGVTWGTPADYARIDRDFDAVQAWARRNDRPILLGEFGTHDTAPMESRARYEAAVARAAEKRGWAWAVWQFDGDFVVYDLDHDRWVQALHEALIPAPAH